MQVRRLRSFLGALNFCLPLVKIEDVAWDNVDAGGQALMSASHTARRQLLMARTTIWRTSGTLATRPTLRLVQPSSSPA